MRMWQTDSLTARVAEQGTAGSPSAGVSQDTLHGSSAQRGFSVWRIAQNMGDCTPQQLDSAIQAQLPQRERVRSERPDTLSLPGLPGRKPYEAEDRIVNFEEGFFKGNPVLHPELPYRSQGRSAVPIPYMLSHDDLVTSSLLLCFLILVYVINKTRRQLAQQTKNFFFIPKENSGLFAVETAIESRARLFIVFQLCLMGGLLSFTYAQYSLDLFLGQVSPRILLCIYIGSFMAYFILKRIMNAFVNWIFFPKSQQKLWNDSYSYLIFVESLAFFPLALIFVYFNLPFEKGIWMFLFLLLIVKMLLAFKTLRIFFPKSYGLFHLFAYLCALELMPMFALWRLLAFITDSLIVKY